MGWLARNGINVILTAEQRPVVKSILVITKKYKAGIPCPPFRNFFIMHPWTTVFDTNYAECDFRKGHALVFFPVL